MKLFRAPARIVAVALMVALPWVLAPARALADPTALDSATAQSLFDDAMKLMAAKKHAEACPMLEESHRLDPAMGTKFRLAECYEAIGRTASAWVSFIDVADLAKAAGQGERDAAARERATKLLPRLSRLTIAVSAPETAGLEVRRGNVVVGKGQWGSPIPVDPGTYVLAASAPGRKSWTANAVVAGEGTTSSITVPALEDAAARAPGPRVELPPPPPGDTLRGSGQRTLGGVLAGAGLAALGTGGVLALVAKSKFDAAGVHCGGGSCDPEGKRITDDARGLGNVATIVFGAGAALAAGGIVLWLTAPSRSGANRAASQRTRDRRATTVRLGPNGIFVEGSF